MAGTRHDVVRHWSFTGAWVPERRPWGKEDRLMFPNASCSWTPVALSADLPVATVIPAWTPNGSLALWRSQSGVLSASADRCPHRGMRLSHGFVRGEALSCIYHGWSYGQSGQCTRIPAHPDLVPPDAIRVAVSRVAEVGGVIWITADESGPIPPSIDAAPLRSLTTAADAAAIGAAAGAAIGSDGMLRLSLAGTSVCLLLAPQAQPGTLIHVLVDAAADQAAKIAVSRAVEILRRRAETIFAEGAAA